MNPIYFRICEIYGIGLVAEERRAAVQCPENVGNTMKWQQQICMEFLSLMCSARVDEQYSYGAPHGVVLLLVNLLYSFVHRTESVFISCPTLEGLPDAGPDLCGTSSLRRIECSFQNSFVTNSFVKRITRHTELVSVCDKKWLKCIGFGALWS